MRHAHVSATRLLRLGPLPHPLRFRGTDDLLAAVRSILRGWTERPLDPRRGACPALRVSRSRHGYRRVSTRLDRPSLARAKERKTLVEALCGIHGELIDWYVETRPEDLFLHGAAVQFGARLVVFPALAKAGKSTLTVQLAAAGYPVFSDDVLPIHLRTGQGEAMGMVPRLRPPLPPSLGPTTRRFVAERAGPRRTNRFYVLLREGECVPYGVRAPIGGVVLLERAAGARATLTPIDPADALEALLLQNFTTDRPAAAILDALAGAVEGSACYRLRYARGAAAIERLGEAFGPPPGGAARSGL